MIFVNSFCIQFKNSLSNIKVAADIVQEYELFPEEGDQISEVEDQKEGCANVVPEVKHMCGTHL